MRFGVLGPLAVWTDAGEAVTIPGKKVRVLLADLLVHRGQVVSADRLIDDLWGDESPANAAGALQVRVSQLRRALEEGETGARDLIVSRPPGYVLLAGAQSTAATDADEFAALTEAKRFPEALALWRGAAYADVADEEFARTAITRLEELRLAAIEEHAEVRLARGEHGTVAAELSDLVGRHPLRERLRAAHMRALYQAGRQSEALDSYHDLRDRLAEELGLDPGPDLAELYQSILRHEASERPATNLPASLTSLVGREEAVAAVKDRLATSRLVTLTGPGGVGKTRLAMETASQLVGAQPDGVWLVELAGTDAPADSVAEVLGIVQTGPDSLITALRERRLLIVLDNCEHVIDAAAALANDLLRAAPGVRILATSREPLDVAGETTWPVPPLRFPSELAAPDPVTLLETSSAVRLFADRAAAAAPDFELTADTTPAVAMLCRRLDGLPLALELAATRVRTLGVQGVADRLGDRFRLLSAGHRGAPDRHRTLSAVIDWSWQLLPEPERVVLRRLAVHHGGCTIEAAEATCGPDALDLLPRLVDRSLVVRTAARYRLLESVAEYCGDRLREADELDRTRHSMIDYYAALAVQAESHLRGHDQRRWLERLDAETANLRAAFDGAVQGGDGAAAVRMANALVWYWIMRGRLAEARRSFEASLAIAEPGEDRTMAIAWHAGIVVMTGDVTGWEARRDEALRAADDAGPRARAIIKSWLGFTSLDTGDVDTGENLMNEGLEMFRGSGDEWWEAFTLTARAKTLHARGELAALEEAARRSQEIFERLGDGWGILAAGQWLGAIAEMTGDLDGAVVIHENGLRIAEELGLQHDVVSQLAWLGWVAMEQRDNERATEYGRRALRAAAKQAFRPGEVFAELVLSYAARRDGRLGDAEERLRSILKSTPDTDPPPFYVTMILCELGYIAELRGDPDTALSLHLEAFDTFDDAPRDRAGALEGLAGALAAAGQHDLAATFLGTASAARESAGMPAAPADLAELERITARILEGTTTFDASYEQGRTLTPDQARAQIPA